MNGRFYNWEHLDTAELLKVRLCDLQLDVKHSPIQLQIGQLYAEIALKGIRFKPHVWISTSWFSPYGIPGFAIPFYLMHPRLAALEKRYIGEVEGGTDEWCMQLLRHETGHAIDNAFHLRKSKQRQKLFGLSGKPYPVRYAPDPSRTDFVCHLKNHYAQAHPDEDWAETFAVWLDPNSDWREKYRGWEALEKLELTDELLSSIAGKKQGVFNSETTEDISQCTQTLKEYFYEKQRKYGSGRPKNGQKLVAQGKPRHYGNENQRKHWILM